jgi:hypothetical protein
MITPEMARRIYDNHEMYWRDRRPEMRRLRNAYLMRYWQRNMSYDANLLIETSRAYELIESFVASLFVRNPSVVVKADIRGNGDPELTQEVVNTWLIDARREIEDAMRQALIYPWAAIKLCPNDTKDVLRRVELTSVGPWDILVDESSGSWQTQRFVGHRYYVPIEEAKKRYGDRDYAVRTFKRYIDYQDDDDDAPALRRDEDPIARTINDYVLVVEFYDLVDERMVVWSPDFDEGNTFLYDGIELDVGVEGIEAEKFDGIPFRTVSDRPVVPIVPLYMSREPDEPLRGYSALRRVYDQVVEINTIRTFQANGIRRAARQWIVEKGLLDEEAMSKIAQGQDGEFIEVEVSPGQDLRTAIAPMPHSPVPNELQVYEQQVDDDFARGSIMAPFTRGEATKATATEITALAAYSASEIGRMARERDAAISHVAQCYAVMLATLLGDEDEMVRLNDKVQVLSSDDLTGDFGYFAEDSGATPMTEAVRKQELMNLIPVLQALGTPNDVILKNLVRVYGLSEDFLPAPQPEMPPGAAQAAAQGGGMGVGVGEIPQPGSVRAMLPDGDVI